MRCDLCHRGCVGSLPLFRGLPSTDIRDIQRLVTHGSYRKGDAVIREGDPLAAIYIVEHGQAKVFAQNPNGGEQVLRWLQAGDFYGELALVAATSAPSTVQALTDLRICSISASGLRNYLLQHPAATLSILEAVANRLRQAERLSEQLGLMSSRQRVAALLLHLAERQGHDTSQGKRIQLYMNREELAAMIGLRQETFSRCLSEFRQQGWVQTEGYKVLYIIDEKMLRSAEQS
ncbi:MAG: Crp/Fnr family transcriptional regulator [Bacillota bacterium]|jgi:CRP-like cAMP-binding protein